MAETSCAGTTGHGTAPQLQGGDRVSESGKQAGKGPAAFKNAEWDDFGFLPPAEHGWFDAARVSAAVARVAVVVTAEHQQRNEEEEITHTAIVGRLRRGVERRIQAPLIHMP
jgi:hypothetical protein